MKNNKKKPSVFKNILIITGCTMFAALYAVTVLYICSGVFDMSFYVRPFGSFAKGGIEKSQSDEKESLPAWVDRVEIELETQTDNWETKDQESADTIEQEPRFDADDDKADERETIEKPKANEETAEETQERHTTQPETNEDETTESKRDQEKDQEIKEEPETGEKKNSKADIHIGNVETIQQADTAKAVVTDVTQVVKAAMPCVVSITNEYTAYDYWYDEEYDEEANGSGIIIAQNDEELLILTNYHVVEDANDLYVQFIDDTEVVAYAKGVAPNEDLAVVSVLLEDVPNAALDTIAIAALGDSDALEVGEPSIAIGNSLGYGQSVTTGVISALNCDIFEDDEEINLSSLIQTDAAINPGNSGGALLNVNGEVVGINSSKIADYAIEGMGYAIPINTARPIVDELVKQETKRKVAVEKRAFLGISGTDVSEDAVEKYEMPEGVYVSSVLSGTAAEKAGIKKGDIVTAIDDQKVTSMSRVQSILEYYEADTKAEITLMRIQDGDYEKMTVEVTFGLKQD